MLFKFGGYTHPVAQVNVESFTQRVVLGPRGYPLFAVKEFALSGFVKGSSASTINTLALLQENLYSQQGVSAGLTFDDGTRTIHWLENGTSRSGVRVVAYDYPKGDSAEFATQRQFSIRLRAEYDIASDNFLVDYVEVLTIRGNGGPRYVAHEFVAGAPEFEMVNAQTAVVITQQGQATGYGSVPSPNPPLSGLGLLQGPGVIKQQRSPDVVGNTYRNYGIQWQYEFLSSGDIYAAPITR